MRIRTTRQAQLIRLGIESANARGLATTKNRAQANTPSKATIQG